MRPITQTEFSAMERLMSNLIDSCGPIEEAALLQLHARLSAIYAAQGTLEASRDRLKALQSRREQ